MISRLTRFYGGTPEAWARRPADISCEMDANIRHLAAEEGALQLLVNHPDDPSKVMDMLKEKAEFHADDEPVNERAARLREKEEALLGAFGASLKDVSR